MKLFVVWVHGGGRQKPGESGEFEKPIREAFERAVQRRGKPKPPPEALVWKEAYWAPVTQADEEKLEEKLRMRGFVRDFIISNVGDAIAYSRLCDPTDKYTAIQYKFNEAIREVMNEAGHAPGTEASLTVITHSLGTVIASDALYDIVHRRQAFPPNLSFDHFVTLSALMALYTLRYGIPGAGTLRRAYEPVRPARAWLNFYYPLDLLGFPLKPINDRVPTTDVWLLPGCHRNPLIAGLRAIVGWLPGIGHVWSHLWYFDDPRVIGRIGQMLADRWDP